MSSSARSTLPSSTTTKTASSSIHPVHSSSSHTPIHSSVHAVRPIYLESSSPATPSSSTSSAVRPQPSQVKDTTASSGRPVPSHPAVSSSALNRTAGTLPVNRGSSGPSNPSVSNATPSSSAVRVTGGSAGTPGPGPKMVAPKEERSFEERSVAESLRRRVTVALSHDQYMTLHPDVSPFEDVCDVIQRLLPYHIWQIPDQDLSFPPPPPSSGTDQKGKARATDWQWDDVASSTPEADITEAVRFAKRKRELEKRFVSLKRREGQHASPSLQAIPLGRAAIADELRQIYHLKTGLRSATSEQSAAINRLNELKRELAALRAPPPPPLPPPQQTLNRPPLQTGSARPPANYTNRGAPLQQRVPISAQSVNGVNMARPLNSGMYRPPSVGTPGRPPAQRPGYPTYRPPIQSSASSSSQVRPSSANLSISSRPLPSASNTRPSVPTTTPSSTSGASHIDLHAPVPLSLPASTLPTLMNLGIIPRTNSAPDAPSLVWNLRVDGVNIAFNLILGTLSPAQLSGLAGILSKVQAGNGSGTSTSTGSSAASSSSSLTSINNTAPAASAAAAAVPRLPPLASSARLGQGPSGQGTKPDSKVKTGPGP
ncbi:hypothetical protein [Phaffia rhodozyma]|uniref:GLTSCR protein conserved domain-containing protein n=1 Tax=Phaffia rhodozyma TaxID=264483 RepID=A0A0F7SHR3_PHARH|nr:hypothetical protein [Phaffia rhodozyma]